MTLLLSSVRDGPITSQKALPKPMASTILIFFSPVAKLTFVKLFLSLAATHNWHLHKLDIKFAFLHRDLHEEVFMEQPPGFVAHGGVWSRVSSFKSAIWAETKSSCLVWKF